MSFNIGQIKFDDLSFPADVYTPINLNNPNGTYESDSVDGGYNFNRLVYKGFSLQRNVCYFMRIYIKRQAGFEQNITINLRSEDGSVVQKCKSIKIEALPSGTTNNDSASIYDPKQWTHYSFMIMPNQNSYSKICFELPEFLAMNGRIVKARVNLFNQVTNLIKTKIQAKHNVDRLVKIGVQSRPGTIICVNGEEIRIGRTGFYEINSSIEITYLGFGAELQDFILDYVYDMDAVIKEEV